MKRTYTYPEKDAEKHKDFHEDSRKTVILVGNPNVGKSVIFSLLTRSYVMVSNYPGTTVEFTRGVAQFDDWQGSIIDSPGVNSFIPSSEDEKVTRDIVLHGKTDGILQIADAKNLRRALPLTLELVEMGLPFSLDLNMMDEARTRGIKIDIKKLEKILGVDVVPTVAVRKKGLRKLARILLHQNRSQFTFHYSTEIEKTIEKCVKHLPEVKISRRALAVMLLSGDASLWSWIGEKVDADDLTALRIAMRRLEETLKRPVPAVIAEQRMRVCEWIFKQVATKAGTGRRVSAGKIGDLSIHPIWGVPLLAMVLLVMYLLVGVFGAEYLVDLIEGGIFERYINPWFVSFVESIFSGLLPEQIYRFVSDLLIGEYGLMTMAITYSIAIVLPIVGTFFFVFGILEDSGYLPRIAVMLNRLFRIMGLNGKAVLPMVLGLGCDTMATITTRILETRKERIITTLLLALGVPCSAQLGVILGMLAGLSHWAAVIWVCTITAILFLVGFLSAKMLGGRGSDFILEIPPLRVPRFSNIAIKTLARIEWYLKEAVPLFILGTLILFGLHWSGVLTSVYEFSAPLVTGILGLPAQASEAFIVGFLRRDYGAAGLYAMAEQGRIDSIGVLVGIVTITLFVPCIANLLIMIKERGLVTTLYMVLFIVPFAFLVGGILNHGLRLLGVAF